MCSGEELSMVSYPKLYAQTAFSALWISFICLICPILPTFSFIPFEKSHREFFHSSSLVHRSLVSSIRDLQREGGSRGPLIPVLSSVFKEKSSKFLCTLSTHSCTFNHDLHSNVRKAFFISSLLAAKSWRLKRTHKCNSMTTRPLTKHVTSTRNILFALMFVKFLLSYVCVSVNMTKEQVC